MNSPRSVASIIGTNAALPDLTILTLIPRGFAGCLIQQIKCTWEDLACQGFRVCTARGRRAFSVAVTNGARILELKEAPWVSFRPKPSRMSDWRRTGGGGIRSYALSSARGVSYRKIGFETTARATRERTEEIQAGWGPE